MKKIREKQEYKLLQIIDSRKHKVPKAFSLHLQNTHPLQIGQINTQN